MVRRVGRGARTRRQRVNRAVPKISSGKSSGNGREWAETGPLGPLGSWGSWGSWVPGGPLTSARRVQGESLAGGECALGGGFGQEWTGVGMWRRGLVSRLVSSLDKSYGGSLVFFGSCLSVSLVRARIYQFCVPLHTRISCRVYNPWNPLSTP